MIKEELINGNLIKHYSDSGFFIRQVETGAMYLEAIDLYPCKYTYEETTELINKPEEPEESEDEEIQENE